MSALLQFFRIGNLIGKNLTVSGNIVQILSFRKKSTNRSCPIYFVRKMLYKINLTVYAGVTFSCFMFYVINRNPLNTWLRRWLGLISHGYGRNRDTVESGRGRNSDCTYFQLND
jgi:surface polysaccharide O-acyltransferase-like enzyme